VQVEDVQDLSEINKQHQVPSQLQSCHTAIVDGYIITGHVPVQEVNRLLAERPDTVGLAVAGMPIGSPGMEVADAAPQPFDVVTFDRSGAMEIYASYSP
jgi:hypothetical protein